MALLKTSPQDGSSSFLSASMASRISCSWPFTSRSSTGLSRSLLMMFLAYRMLPSVGSRNNESQLTSSTLPRCASHRGDSHRKGDKLSTNSENKI